MNLEFDRCKASRGVEHRVIRDHGVTIAVHQHDWGRNRFFLRQQVRRRQRTQEHIVPFMGPPVLTDHETDTTLAQTPAILHYLGRKYDLIPEDPAREALTIKLVADANDVLYEMTRYNGEQMWDPESWRAYKPRLRRWMEIFEETGRRQGLKPGEGYILGTAGLGLADLTAHVLWGTMTAKLPSLRPLLEEAAPAVAGLSDRIALLPEQVELRERSDKIYGDEWCSGQIEASLRAVL